MLQFELTLTPPGQYGPQNVMQARIFASIRGLRRRERWLAMAWGAARWLVLIVAVLFLACLLDWSIDRWHSTPGWLRAALSLVQACVALGAAFWLIGRPLWRRTSDSMVAAWLESWDA